MSIFIGPLVDESLIYEDHSLLFVDFLVESKGFITTTSFSLLSFSIKLTWFVRRLLLVLVGCSISP